MLQYRSRQLDERFAEPPRIDGNGLERDLAQAEVAHLRGDEVRGGALLGSPGDPEPERVRAERCEPVDDVPQVALVDPQLRASSKPRSTSRTSGPMVARS